jgi:hypothetical protein
MSEPAERPVARLELTRPCGWWMVVVVVMSDELALALRL